jgi:ubiquinone/menaquinone biosynthesis C-methylase UbiE
MSETLWANAPWEHPDWYDIHDTAWTAGPEREPEHYREMVIALPPLDAGDHLLDVGCGTGKLAALVARGYPKLGRVTLLEPNALKLERAVATLRELLPKARVDGVVSASARGKSWSRQGSSLSAAF